MQTWRGKSDKPGGVGVGAYYRVTNMYQKTTLSLLLHFPTYFAHFRLLKVYMGLYFEELTFGVKKNLEIHGLIFPEGGG